MFGPGKNITRRTLFRHPSDLRGNEQTDNLRFQSFSRSRTHSIEILKEIQHINLEENEYENRAELLPTTVLGTSTYRESDVNKKTR